MLILTSISLTYYKLTQSSTSLVLIVLFPRLPETLPSSCTSQAHSIRCTNERPLCDIVSLSQIPFCRNTVAEQRKVIEAVEEEIQMMAKLNHPNIVRILGATRQTCHFFMFVEWMPGMRVCRGFPVWDIATTRKMKTRLFTPPKQSTLCSVC